MVKVKVYAKINLSLYVGAQVGGYHELDSVVASVDIADVVCARKALATTVCFRSGLRGEGTNAQRVASYMQSEFGLGGFEIFIEDNIPSSCGLGGSSADCVGVIIALDELFELNLSLEKKREIALRFGSDTAYMLSGGYARMQGRGQKISFFSSNFLPEITVAYKGGVSTAECFKLFDSIGADGWFASNDLLIEYLHRENPRAYELMQNHLTKPAIMLNGDIDKIMRLSSDYPRVMTGSGSAVVIFSTEQGLIDALKGIGASVITTKIRNSGVSIIKE